MCISGKRTTADGIIILEEGPLHTVNVFEVDLHLRLLDGASDYMDDWKSLDWAALEESVSGFSSLKQVVVWFQPPKDSTRWSAANQQQLEAVAEELNRGETLARLYRAGKLIVRVARRTGRDFVDEEGYDWRTLVPPPAKRTSLHSTLISVKG